MSVDLDDYRRAVLFYLADLPEDKLRVARETVDEWLTEREDGPLPLPERYTRELRVALGADVTASPIIRLRRWLRRGWPFVTATVALTGVLTWWLSTNADLHVFGGRVWSDTMPHGRYNTVFSLGTEMFRCQKGTLDVGIYLSTDRRVELVDVSLPVIDDAWAIPRTATATTYGPVSTEQSPLKGFQTAGATYINLRYSFDRCPVLIEGSQHSEHVDIVYRLFGREHRETLELVAPITLTTCQLTKTAVRCPS